MENKICAVCKQPIDDLLVIETSHGPVHPGSCLDHVESLTLAESEECLTETELLL